MVCEGHTVGVHCVAHVAALRVRRRWGRRDADRALTMPARARCRPACCGAPRGATPRRGPRTSPPSAGCGSSAGTWTPTTGAATRAEACSRPPTPGLVPGAVVLAHDGIGPGARRPTAAETVAYAEQLIGHARAIGTYSGGPVTVTDPTPARRVRARPDPRTADRRSPWSRSPPGRRPATSSRGARFPPTPSTPWPTPACWAGPRSPGPTRPPAARELALVRAVAAADGSVGRIYDGHLNAIERLAVQGSAGAARARAGRFATGELRGRRLGR